jgi:hypothetical protein
LAYLQTEGRVCLFVIDGKINTTRVYLFTNDSKINKRNDNGMERT